MRLELARFGERVNARVGINGGGVGLGILSRAAGSVKSAVQ